MINDSGNKNPLFCCKYVQKSIQKFGYFADIQNLCIGIYLSCKEEITQKKRRKEI